MKLTIQPAPVAISGGLGDIGRAMARVFADSACAIAVGDLAEKADGLPEGAFYHRLDVTDPVSVAEWFQAVATQFGCPPAYVIPNAAIVTTKRFFDLTPSEWKRELDINLNGAFYFANEGARRLVETNSSGRIVFVGSWAGHAPHRELPAYCVAKAGLRMLTRTLALELASRRILVNEVAPGYVDAGLSGRMFSANPQLKEQAQNRVPIHQLISADEVAAQVLFLCSNASSQTTGTTLLQDGGLSLTQEPMA